MKRFLVRALRVLALPAVLYLSAFTEAARTQEVVADLSDHLVGITTGFTGTNVLLFGATEGEGDVIVVVRGPLRSEVVRRKMRIVGVWVNGAEMEFAGVPSFYAVASSRPVDELLNPRLRARHHIGTRYLDLRPAERGLEPAEIEPFRDGLVRGKIRDGLYVDRAGHVTFLGNRLFRTRLHFPANVPTGLYTVETLLIHQGAVVSAQTSPLLISKVGVGAEIYQFAHRHSVLYGIIAIVLALAAGWTAGAVFRKA